MSYRKIFWGALLVIVGILLILKNLGVIYFTWCSAWHLWPVILILWGLSLLPIRDLYKVIISLVVLAASLVFFFRSDYKEDCNFNWNSDWNDENTDGVNNQKLNEPYDTAIRTALLQFDAAAGKFTLNDTTEQLIDLSKSGIIGNYSMEIQNTGDSATVNIDMHGEKNIHTKRGNSVEMKLNTRPNWNFEFSAGAAELDLDLSKFKVSSLNIDGGACSVFLKIGNLQKNTKMDIETGASSITLKIPKEAGCEVNTETFMTSKSLEGFSKTQDGTYQTANYKTATQKIDLKVDAAVSSLTIERY
ncbi:MAG: DUF5668 domain-containing protein [Bacteroidota bacterium]